MELNPFNILNVYADCSAKELAASKARLTAFTSVGKVVKDLVVSASEKKQHNVTTVQIQAAYNTLQQPSNKINYALLWFFKPEVDDLRVLLEHGTVSEIACGFENYYDRLDNKSPKPLWYSTRSKLMIKYIGHYLTIVCIYIMLTVSVAVSAQTRRALVIGIGQQEDKAWGKINGDKDVPFVEEMLKNAKFKAGNVKKLINQQATKAAIVNAFKSLASQSKRGDIVYVHFSGHGQQMKDMHNDEKDGLDECWIPYDAYRKPCEKDKGEKHLTDDEVNYYLNAIRDKIGDSGKMLVVIDACHSGDATRGDENEVVRGVEDIFEAIKSFIWGVSTDKGKTDVNPNAQVNKERWITISACKSDQVNIEMKSPAVGKLTYAIYNKVKENTGNDNDDFIRRIRKFVNSNTGSRPQYPEMTGETDRYRITDIIQ